uniref:hypothetical protein n=1 Tax=Blautia wexlerae TaxID=418240 RepID=UPI0031BB3BB1
LCTVMNNSYITIIKEKRTVLSRKRVPLNQNECTADFGIGVPFEQNLQYSSMFIAIDELTKLIPWHKIVQSYFSNDIKIYKKTLGKDLIPFLNDVDTLLKNYPALYPNNKNKLQTYQKARNDIIKIISNHTL